MCCFQLQVLSKFKETSVVLAGDGRCDSPGKSAKFCTYSVIEKDKHLILHFEIVDKREVSLKSLNMKREAMGKNIKFFDAAHDYQGIDNRCIHFSSQNIR